MLEVKDITFTRGEDGQLLAQEITLDVPGNPTVKVKPLTRGKLQEIYSKATGDIKDRIDADNMAIREGLVEPSLTEQQIEDLRPSFAAAITTAVMSISLGVTQADVKGKAQEALAEQEDELKKKS